MRKLALLAFAMLASAPVYAQTAQPVFSGAQTAGTPTTATNGTTVFVPWMACTDAANNRISCGGGGTAGTPSSQVTTVQGAQNGYPQNVAVTNQSYTLATNATSSGAQSPIAGSYVLNLPSAFNGATIAVTFTSNNGNATTASYTATPATPPRFDLYAGTTVTAAVTGGTPTGNTTLSGGPTNGAAGIQPTYQTYSATSPTPVSTTVSTTTVTDSAAFTPQLGRPINLLLTGTWAGTVQLLRSLDGGTTKIALTYVDGSAKGSYTGNAQTPIANESEAGATYYLRFTLTSGSATGRLS